MHALYLPVMHDSGNVLILIPIPIPGLLSSLKAWFRFQSKVESFQESITIPESESCITGTCLEPCMHAVYMSKTMYASDMGMKPLRIWFWLHEAEVFLG